MSGKTHVVDMEFDLQSKACRMWKDPFDEEIERFLEEDERTHGRRKVRGAKKAAKRRSSASESQGRVIGAGVS
jgi:hypothetical protein